MNTSTSPAFDKARDLALSLGHTPISPADVDRDHNFDEKTATQESVSGPEANRTFARRDCDILIGLRAEDGDGIALLPGWQWSTGAVAEFFLARWLGLKVVDATTFEPFSEDDVYGMPLRCIQNASIRYLLGT